VVRECCDWLRLRSRDGVNDTQGELLIAARALLVVTLECGGLVGGVFRASAFLGVPGRDVVSTGSRVGPANGSKFVASAVWDLRAQDSVTVFGSDGQFRLLELDSAKGMGWRGYCVPDRRLNLLRQWSFGMSPIRCSCEQPLCLRTENSSKLKAD
jgi:hypothetical protein